MKFIVEAGEQLTTCCHNTFHDVTVMSPTAKNV